MKKNITTLAVLSFVILFLTGDVNAQDGSVENIKAEIHRHREAIKRLKGELRSLAGEPSAEEEYYEDAAYEESYSEDGYETEYSEEEGLRKPPPLHEKGPRKSPKEGLGKRPRHPGKSSKKGLGKDLAPGKGHGKGPGIGKDRGSKKDSGKGIDGQKGPGKAGGPGAKTSGGGKKSGPGKAGGKGKGGGGKRR